MWPHCLLYRILFLSLQAKKKNENRSKDESKFISTDTTTVRLTRLLHQRFPTLISDLPALVVMHQQDERRNLNVRDVFSKWIRKLLELKRQKPLDIGGKIRSIKMYPLRSNGVIFWKRLFFFKFNLISATSITFILRLMHPRCPIHKCYCHRLLFEVSERTCKPNIIFSVRTQATDKNSCRVPFRILQSHC